MSAARGRRAAEGRGPGHREERRKRLEVFGGRKMAAQKQSVPATLPDIRSPLMERSNRGLQKRPEKVKPSEKKKVEPVNKENIHPAVDKDGKSVTVSQCFLKARALKEKDEKVKLEATKEEPKPPPKSVLGAYRGRIVHSKIASFWKNSENKDLPEKSKAMPKCQVKGPQSSASVPAKTRVQASNDVKPKRPVIPSVSSQPKPSTAPTKSKAETGTARRTTQVPRQQRPIQQKTQPVKPPLKTGAVKNNPKVQGKNLSSGPVETLPDPQKYKPAPSLPTASKFPRARESAEERKARLAEWRLSKGKVIKRPSMAVAKPSTSSVQEEEPREPKEETRQHYWAAMAEEDEQELFTLKIHQIFGDCQKLIEEGCPREEVLSILEKQVETVPEAKKISGYWECLARLEKRDGQLYRVIAVCEEAVSAGAQPLEELRAILADALEQLKPDPEENVEELNAEIKDETVAMTVKGKRRGKNGAMKSELKSPSTPEKLPESESTPQNRDTTSSVIRFNIRSTPHLEKMKRLPMSEGESSITGYKFLTPVRRSSRLEHKCHRLPEMLKDHDPCVSGIDELGDLEDTEACASAYIFRKNSALREVTARSATKK